MNFSVFDDTMGDSGKATVPTCNCLHGYAYIGEGGNCGCSMDPAASECQGVWIEGVGCTGGTRTGVGTDVPDPVPTYYPGAVIKELLRNGDGGVFAHTPLGNTRIIDTDSINKTSATATASGTSWITSMLSNPIVVIGALGAGLWALSAMGGDEKTKGGKAKYVS